MRWIARFVFIGLSLLAAAFPTHARAANEVAVEPNLVASGQTVTLRWYFTGDKVLLSGGRFGKGVVVTGRQSVIDHPKTTTKYKFDVWYRPGVAANGTVASAPGAQVHVQYTALAEVGASTAVPMQSYRHPNGWQISVLAGWRHDNVTTEDEGSDGLVYFQKEKDSVERIVIAVMPAGDLTVDALMKKITSDVYSKYDNAVISDPTALTYENVDAQEVTFTGMDQSHPGTKTQSIVLAFVRNGKGYVISGRTDASVFRSRQALLERMLRSFSFVKRITRSI